MRATALAALLLMQQMGGPQVLLLVLATLLQNTMSPSLIVSANLTGVKVHTWPLQVRGFSEDPDGR